MNTNGIDVPEELHFKELNRTQITAISIAVICVLSIFIAVWLPLRFSQAQITVRIPNGATLSQISEELENKGVIRNRYLFMVYASALGEGRNMKAGKYMFDNGDSLTDVVAKISKGLALPDDVSTFIPEGYNVWEIDARLTDLGFVQKGEFARTYLQDEGELFPDTYKINSDNVIYKDANGQMVNGLIDYMKRDSVIKAIGSKMLQNYQKQTQDLLKDLSPEKAREIIIIASMLEKEVRGQKDMAIVAGIIYKRLSLGMPLQIDATVGYGACLRNFKATDSKINCDVTQIAIGKEIRIDSEFNTYTRKGLPVGPISNPGIASIKAALNPQKSPYVFYLSTSDGQIVYSKTGWEHVSNRAKYMGL
jgi:UPF0755 protein